MEATDHSQNNQRQQSRKGLAEEQDQPKEQPQVTTSMGKDYSMNTTVESISARTSVDHSAQLCQRQGSKDEFLDQQRMRLNSVSSVYSTLSMSPNFSLNNPLPLANPPPNLSNLSTGAASATPNANSMINFSSFSSLNTLTAVKVGLPIYKTNYTVNSLIRSGTNSASTSRKSSFNGAIRPEYPIHATTVQSLLGMNHSSSSLNMNMNDIALCQTDSDSDSDEEREDYIRKQTYLSLKLKGRTDSITNSEVLGLDLHRQNSFSNIPPTSLKYHPSNNNTGSYFNYPKLETDSTPLSPGADNFSDTSVSASNINTPQGGSYLNPKISSPLLNPPSSSNSDYNKSPGLYFKSGSRSKKNLTPRLKSFSRIAGELQNEISPFDSEIQHEFQVTSTLKEEFDILNTNSASKRQVQNDNLKKFEMINKANEAWSQNKFNSIKLGECSSSKESNSLSIPAVAPNAISPSSSSSLATGVSSSSGVTASTEATATSNSIPTDAVSSSTSDATHQSTPPPALQISRLKRKSFSRDEERYVPSSKKRIISIPSPVLSSVTSSPSSVTSPGPPMTTIFPPSRRNSNKLVQRASDDLESMSLR